MTSTQASAPANDERNVKLRGDRAWTDAANDTLGRLSSQVQDRANDIKGDVGVDEVHDMRTATRRLRTAIELHRDEAPKKRLEAVEDELKRVTRRLGAVRDLDVLLEDLDASTKDGAAHADGRDVEPLRDAWRAERASGARRLKSELRRRRFRRALKNAKRLVPREAGPAASTETDRVATQAPALIWDVFGVVLSHELDPRTADPTSIHQLRKAAKKLRYTLEAFEDALEPGATLIDEVTALQDAAGSMHDGIVAADRARMTVRDADVTRRERRAIHAFAEARLQRSERLRPDIAKRLRTIRSRAFRTSLGRAVAGMGHVRI